MRSRKGFLVAGIVAATGALICCAGPLVVLAIGAGGTWLGASPMLEHYRPVLVGLMLPLLAVGLYKLRRVCASGCSGPPGLKRPRLAIWAAVSLVLSLAAIWFWLSPQC
jgi:mercuric ion transport protein